MPVDEALCVRSAGRAYRNTVERCRCGEESWSVAGTLRAPLLPRFDALRRERRMWRWRGAYVSAAPHHAAVGAAMRRIPGRGEAAVDSVGCWPEWTPMPRCCSVLRSHAVPSRAEPGRAVLCRTMPCRAEPCRAVSCRLSLGRDSE